MKGFQALLKVEQRKVSRDKRDKEMQKMSWFFSKHQEGSAQRNGYGLGPNRWSIVRFGQSPSDMFNVGPDRESNDLVNHIGCVFRYFIADVVDPGYTSNVAHCGRELAVSEHRLIDSWSPRLEEERHMKKFPSETEETRKVKEIFGFKRSRKTVGCSSQKLHKFMDKGFTRLRVTHKIRWWQAVSIRKNGFWLVEESQRSHQVSVTETCCTSTKRKLKQGKKSQNSHQVSVAGIGCTSTKKQLEQGQARVSERKNERERRFKVRLSLKILVKDIEKCAGGIGLNRLLRLVVILRKTGMKQQSSTLVQEAEKSLPQLVEACQHGQLKGVRAERKGYSMTRGSWICSECQGQKCQDQLTSTRHIIRSLSKCKEKSTAFKRKGTGGVLDIWLHHRGILRQCPQESPLANDQVLIDGQVLIRLMAVSMTNRRVQVVDGDIKISQAAREESQGVSWIRWYEAQFIQLTVGSKSSSGVGSKGFSETSRFYYNMRVSPGLFRKSVQQGVNAHEWNRKAKEEINLQKDVQVSLQALEQVRDFDSKLGSQLKTLDEGDENSEWQWDCHIPSSRMSMFQEDYEGTSRFAQDGAERSEKR
ncbi:hypothetical protein F2Q68_00011901 [Brassica cretica]|uniref:Uncharacterized protein n=1 Tax=Brassica cretica TaxID=69181 RepID=A0A8S9L2G3_BRACR|nr:hypothetical protein F2Q68_00011901 [Brassica cretica]